MLTTKLHYLPNALTLALDIYLHMVSSSKQAGGDLTEDTVQLVPSRRRAERKRRTSDAKDAEDAARADRASTSDGPAPVTSKRKSKKAKESSKNE